MKSCFCFVFIKKKLLIIKQLSWGFLFIYKVGKDRFNQRGLIEEQLVSVLLHTWACTRYKKKCVLRQRLLWKSPPYSSKFRYDCELTCIASVRMYTHRFIGHHQTLKMNRSPEQSPLNKNPSILKKCFCLSNHLALYYYYYLHKI